MLEQARGRERTSAGRGADHHKRRLHEVERKPHGTAKALPGSKCVGFARQHCTLLHALESVLRARWLVCTGRRDRHLPLWKRDCRGVEKREGRRRAKLMDSGAVPAATRTAAAAAADERTMRLAAHGASVTYCAYASAAACVTWARFHLTRSATRQLKKQETATPTVRGHNRLPVPIADDQLLNHIQARNQIQRRQNGFQH